MYGGPIDMEQLAASLQDSAGDQDRVDVAGIHARYDRSGRITERRHVHPIRAQHDDVRLLAWRQ